MVASEITVRTITPPKNLLGVVGSFYSTQYRGKCRSKFLRMYAISLVTISVAPEKGGKGVALLVAMKLRGKEHGFRVMSLAID